MQKRVLIVNKFFYPRGGDCVVAMNEKKLLDREGYTTAVYAMDYNKNIDTGWNRFYASEISFGGNIRSKSKAFGRLMGHGDIRRSFKSMLDEFKPDTVHFHNIHSYLSPEIVKVAKEHGARTLWTMHDYKLVCPAYSCLSNGEVCEACLTDKRNVIRHKCHKSSTLASYMAWLEAKKWSIDKLQQYTDLFVCPSEFMCKMLIKGGVSADKIVHVCNFTDLSDSLAGTGNSTRENFYMYAGRLSEEKGLRTLLDSAKDFDMPLHVYGGGPLEGELKERYGCYGHIKFFGHRDGDTIARNLAKARFSVLPSEWYENNPLGIIESLCAGTPVVGSSIGGIPELISPHTGLLFRSGDSTSLTQALLAASRLPWDNEAIARESTKRFSPQTYMETMGKLY